MRVCTPPGYTDSVDLIGCVTEGSWRQEEAGHTLQPLAYPGQKNHAAAASQARDRFDECFSSPTGELTWQVDYVH